MCVGRGAFYHVHPQEIQSLLINWKGLDLTTYGELVLEGTFHVLRAKNTRTLFLFERMLLITKKRGEHYVYKIHISVCCFFGFFGHFSLMSGLIPPPLSALPGFFQESPQRLILFHLTFSSASSSLTPITCMSSLTTCMNLLPAPF